MFDLMFFKMISYICNIPLFQREIRQHLLKGRGDYGRLNPEFWNGTYEIYQQGVILNDINIIVAMYYLDECQEYFREKLIKT